MGCSGPRLTAIKGWGSAVHTLRSYRRRAMSRFVPHRHLWSPARLSSADLHALLHTAAALDRAKQPNHGWRPLDGRHVALLCNCADDTALSFQRAVHGLGGTVALLDANDWLSSAFERVPDAARMLGRFYNAIDCCDLPAPLVEQIEAHSGVPVFNGLAWPEHPLRQLIVNARAAHGALPAVPLEDEPLLALQALIVCGVP
jgi:ornithine carbamoyltransferase